MTADELERELAAHRAAFGVGAPTEPAPRVGFGRMGAIRLRPGAHTMTPGSVRYLVNGQPMAADQVVRAGDAISIAVDMETDGPVVPAVVVQHQYTDPPRQLSGIGLSYTSPRRFNNADGMLGVPPSNFFAQGSHADVAPKKPAAPRAPAWLALARLALQERRSASPGGVSVGYRCPPDTGLRFRHFTYYANDDLPDATELDGVQEDEVLEALAVACGERLAEVASRPLGQRPELPGLARACPLCGSDAGKWCAPTHAGERDPGDWLHPARHKLGLEDGAPTPDPEHEHWRQWIEARRAWSTHVRQASKPMNFGSPQPYHYPTFGHDEDRSRMSVQNRDALRRAAEDARRSQIFGYVQGPARVVMTVEPGRVVGERIDAGTIVSIDPGRGTAVVEVTPPYAQAGTLRDYARLDAASTLELMRNIRDGGISARHHRSPLVTTEVDGDRTTTVTVEEVE